MVKGASTIVSLLMLQFLKGVFDSCDCVWIQSGQETWLAFYSVKKLALPSWKVSFPLMVGHSIGLRDEQSFTFAKVSFSLLAAYAIDEAVIRAF